MSSANNVPSIRRMATISLARPRSDAAPHSAGSPAMNPPFEISTVAHNGAVVLIVSGEVDLASAPELDHALTALGNDDGKPIVIDLDQVTFMDSTGLNVLIKHTQARQDGRMRVSHGSKQVRRLFEISGVAEHLNFV